MKGLTKLPLFPREKRRGVVTLLVRRFEEERWVRAPKLFTVDELPNREAVRVCFDGGRYDRRPDDANGAAPRSRAASLCPAGRPARSHTYFFGGFVTMLP